MKHYVVLCELATRFSNGIAYETHVSGVGHTLDEAKEILATVSVDEKEYAYEHNWEIQENSDVCFCAGEQDNYDEEHAHFYIEEVI